MDSIIRGNTANYPPIRAKFQNKTRGIVSYFSIFLSKKPQLFFTFDEIRGAIVSWFPWCLLLFNNKKKYVYYCDYVCAIYTFFFSGSNYGSEKGIKVKQCVVADNLSCGRLGKYYCETKSNCVSDCAVCPRMTHLFTGKFTTVSWTKFFSR